MAGLFQSVSGEFKTKTTALSQMCHCGNKQKKTLKERWHKCKICNVTAQRDLYSAFLARFVENDKLDISQATKAWVSAGMLFKQAMSNLNKTTIGKDRLTNNLEKKAEADINDPIFGSNKENNQAEVASENVEDQDDGMVEIRGTDGVGRWVSPADAEVLLTQEGFSRAQKVTKSN